MLNARTLSRIFSSISELMEQNRDYLVRLDQVNGDGDLGISMDDGFRAAAAFFAESLESGEETDLGRLLRQTEKPSSTIKEVTFSKTAAWTFLSLTMPFLPICSRPASN